MAAEIGATDRSTRPVPPLPIKLSAECDSIDSFPMSNDYEPVGGFTKLSVGGGEDQYLCLHLTMNPFMKMQVVRLSYELVSP